MAQVFKSVVSKMKSEYGINRKAMYYVEIIPPTTIDQTQTGEVMPVEVLSFYCNAINIPGITYLTEDRFKDGIHRRKAVYDYQYGDLTASFYVDAKLEVEKFFKRWSASIISDRFVATFPDKYSSVIRIAVLNEEEKPVMVYEYYNVFPKSVGDMSFSASGGNEIQTLDITFAYTHFSVNKFEKKQILDALSGKTEDYWTKVSNASGISDKITTAFGNIELLQQTPLFKELASTVNVQSLTKGAISTGIGAIATGRDPRAVGKLFVQSNIANIKANLISFATTKGSSILFGALDGLFTNTTGQLSGPPESSNQ